MDKADCDKASEASGVEKDVEGSSTGDRDAAPSSAAALKREERMKRLRELHLKRNEARKLNHVEVVEEDRKKKLPYNHDAKKSRVEWELAEAEAKKKAEERGDDYGRTKLLDVGADELDRLDRKRKKKNPDQGFSGFADAQFRQYQRLTRQMDPDVEAYDAQKEKLGDDFYATANTILDPLLTAPSKEGVDRMVNDLEKQAAKRAKFSRRRQFFDDADIDYINERNMKFNKKASRYYNKFTAEIKQNLERGTAV
ncbi:pre-mRNA-splicing factor syf2-like [Oscarella lobularis]|uniref:pre-mRNA-splicing factor syf2-like n=1 Tax=Oscarella lobularis TaxID=121494 RepID=UPI0033138990